DHRLVAAAGELAVGVHHVGHAARHSRGEIAPGRTEDHHAPAGHVFAAVIADSFDHRVDAGVAHAEPFAGDAADVRLAAGRAVKGDVADDDVLLGDEAGLFRRMDDDPSARESLADVVVGVALQHQSHSFGNERTETLARRT